LLIGPLPLIIRISFQAGSISLMPDFSACLDPV
jgi:hypothetical protein